MIKPINKKFWAIILSFKVRIFILYITALKIKSKVINILDNIIILMKYFNYIDIFLSKFMIKLLEFNNSNYIIKLKKDKNLFYVVIYRLRSIKLEIFKIYIKINLIKYFIKFF